MLPCNVTLASNVTLWRHLPRTARAALSDVFKCVKISTDFFISVSSQGTAKGTKGQRKLISIWYSTQADQKISHSVKFENFVLSFSNYRYWSLYGDAQAICRLHTVSILTFQWPRSFFMYLFDYLCICLFIYLCIYLFIVEIDDHIYTRSSLTANEIRTQQWSVFIFFFTLQTKILIGIIKQLLPLCEGNMTICSPSPECNITCRGWTNRHVTLTQGRSPRAILPVEGKPEGNITCRGWTNRHVTFTQGQ